MNPDFGKYVSRYIRFNFKNKITSMHTSSAQLIKHGRATVFPNGGPCVHYKTLFMFVERLPTDQQAH